MGEKSDIISERSLTRLIWYILFLILGLACYFTGDMHLAYMNFDDPLKDLGTIVVSGVVLAVLFGWIAERVLDAKLRVMLRNELQSLVKPFVDFAEREALMNYEWDCTLIPASMDDILPFYYYQHINISFRSKLPRNLLFVGAVSNDDDALKEFFEDPSVFLRWPMTIYDKFPDMIHNQNIFKMGNVTIDNRKANLKSRKAIKTAGGDGVVLTYANPAREIGKICQLEFDFIVRKKASDSEPTHIITRIYKNVTSASFRLHLDKSVNATGISIYTTESTPLYPQQENFESKSIKNISGYHLGASAKFMYPLLPGSNIRFEVHHK